MKRTKGWGNDAGPYSLRTVRYRISDGIARAPPGDYDGEHPFTAHIRGRFDGSVPGVRCSLVAYSTPTDLVLCFYANPQVPSSGLGRLPRATAVQVAEGLGRLQHLDFPHALRNIGAAVTKAGLTASAISPDFDQDDEIGLHWQLNADDLDDSQAVLPNARLAVPWAQPRRKAGTKSDAIAHVIGSLPRELTYLSDQPPRMILEELLLEYGVTPCRTAHIRSPATPQGD